MGRKINHPAVCPPARFLFMAGLYSQFILGWERRLNRVDQDRRVTPFDWGGEWLRQTPINGLGAWPPAGGTEEIVAALRGWTDRVIAASGTFFAYPPVTDYRLEQRGGAAALSF